MAGLRTGFVRGCSVPPRSPWEPAGAGEQRGGGAEDVKLSSIIEAVGFGLSAGHVSKVIGSPFRYRF